jgi:DNA recombination protein RmuC
MENAAALLEWLLWLNLALTLLALGGIAFMAVRLLQAGRASLARDLQPSFERLATLAERTEASVRDSEQRSRRDVEDSSRELRREVSQNILEFGKTIQVTLSENRAGVDKKFEEFSRTSGEFSNGLRDEVRKTMGVLADMLKADVKALSDATTQTQDALRRSVTESLERLRADNETRLEAMRATVEEKLQGTLDRRLGESFSQVSDRLELVHKGLGEMQALATGVGDLKRLMSNVKDRGGWAEMQLGALLEDVLARGQYETNARPDPASSEVVEFAIRMPGQAEGADILLPIDAKFPKEDYERLVLAWEQGDAARVKQAVEALAAVFETEAKRIASKYIRPPHTTNFAVMYVPTEGLFAEAMRVPGLSERLQAQHRVTIAGPSTLTALLNSLQLGFRTLAIQKRSSEVWRVLGEAKAEFKRYADAWDRVSKQLQTAQNSIQEVGVRTRAVERRLKDVEIMDAAASIDPGASSPAATFPFPEAADPDERALSA